MARRKSREERSQESRRPVDSVSVERPPRVASRHRFRPARSLVFFVLFYVFIAWGIDVRLLYHCGGLVDNFPCFYRGWDFLRGFLAVPGGAVEYVSALLAQSFYYSWLGAAVVTGQAWVLYACTDCVVKALDVPHLRGLRFLGPLLLLAVYSQYGFPFLTTMGLLAALLGLCLYVKLSSASVVRALGFYLPFCLFLYVAAGGSSLVFVVLGGLYELLARRRPGLGLAEVAFGAAVPYVLGVLVYGIRAYDAYCRLLPLSWELLSHNTFRIMLEAVYALYLFLPVLVVAVGIWRLVTQAREDRAPLAAKTGRPVKVSSRWEAIRTRAAEVFHDKREGTVGWNLSTLVLAGVPVATVLLCRAPAKKDILRTDYFSRQGLWAQVLELGRHSPYRYTVCHAVDRALCRLDRLGDEMFGFPQQPAALLLTDPSADPVWQKFDTCMDLGLINQAENALVLCTEIYGERPLLLHRLATINMIKGNVGAARVFLGALAKVPFWRSVARRDLARLESDPNLSEDAEIQRWRSVMLKTDSVRDVDTLGQLLTENPMNRTAYQYSMAALLLSKNLDGFVRMFDTYHHRNFSRIPRHYEEALLLSETLRRQPADVPGRVVSPKARAQLQEFLRMFRQAGEDKTATRSALRKKFGSTYFYYYFVGA
ncbi:MAG: DUF6057 family protein [Phycisphaerae bacterium]|nr:DUF6057 family protein [Phycisphaerae bacterium]